MNTVPQTTQGMLSDQFYLAMCLHIVTRESNSVYDMIERLAVLRHLLHCWRDHDDTDALRVCEQEKL